MSMAVSDWAVVRGIAVSGLPLSFVGESNGTPSSPGSSGSQAVPKAAGTRRLAPMRYVLVLQFHESYFASYGDLVKFEERLRACMPRTCEVDGHDVGSGTTNFFVFTNAPLAAHKSFRKYLGTNAVERKVRVAYREVDGLSLIHI